ncbi:3-hydroxy acid dehydrogenase / malonic semialdehyde reductase [Flavobacteriales bacterium]|nr:NADP-dependent 3-hydroxy acid dehydrogenase YdfG [Flavobacteriales bacterium]WKZ75340.1 MAG: SDR family NAD(P)-dependent oxidoreductase [Vicingaceae bacterium]GIK70742.1 MAG: short-chain dehydrogenase [Bacteroidota bacterium]CAG0992783.1 3-hydroxy acid dehydrogenase / malonic semialdehyde reductase [Flavobacteriales bacterium]
MAKKIIFITGATSGFGKAMAEIFAQNGHDVIITGRRNERLIELKNTLQNKFNVKVLSLCFDVRNQKEVAEKIQHLPTEWKAIDVLINNAGLASGLDKIQEGNLSDWEKMIDTNVKGLLYVSREIMPLMVNQKKGHIIHIGSTAGKEVYEKGNVYCATKHAVDAISKAMRIDLLEHGIKVTQICPGAAETEFSVVRFSGDTERARQVYNGYKPLTAQDVAEVAYFVTALPQHVCINDLVMTSTAQANSTSILRNSK